MTDVRDAVAQFERSTRLFLDALDGVSDREWGLRPTGETWSLAETVEHVMLTDRSVCARLQQLLAVPLPAGAPRFDDAAISSDMFGTAGTAPPGLAEPKGRFATRAEGIAALVAVRDELVAWVRGTEVDLRAHGFHIPRLAFSMAYSGFSSQRHTPTTTCRSWASCVRIASSRRKGGTRCPTSRRSWRPRDSAVRLPCSTRIVVAARVAVA